MSELAKKFVELCITILVHDDEARTCSMTAGLKCRGEQSAVSVSDKTLSWGPGVYPPILLMFV